MSIFECAECGVSCAMEDEITDHDELICELCLSDPKLQALREMHDEVAGGGAYELP